jgi:hypothetical protein
MPDQPARPHDDAACPHRVILDRLVAGLTEAMQQLAADLAAHERRTADDATD